MMFTRGRFILSYRNFNNSDTATLKCSPKGSKNRTIQSYRGAIFLYLVFVLTLLASAVAADINVGIFDGDTVTDDKRVIERTCGDDGIFKALEEVDGINPGFVGELTPEALKRYDVLILPQTIPDLLPPDFREILKRWVEEGHGLLVTHDAVGYRKCGASIFPEICQGGVSNMPFSNKGIITRKHPVVVGIAPRKIFRHSYYDHIVLSEGEKGTIVIREVRDNEETGHEEVSGPIMIVGEAGKGRYAASGIISGWDKVTIADHRYSQGKEQETPPKGTEREILINTIRWLADSPGIIPVEAGAELVREGEKLAKLIEVVEKPSPEEERQIAEIKSGRADIFPIPKKIEWGKEDISLLKKGKAKAVLVLDDEAGDKETLGAEEIASRCKELGKLSLDIKKISDLSRQELKNNNLILIGKGESRLIQKYLQRHKDRFTGDYLLTKDSPGRQGYIVRYFTNEYGNRCVLLGGSDEQGTLYACYTFLYLIKQKGRRVYALEANIKDWPDYGYRSCSQLYTFKVSSSSPQFNYLERTKEYIDFLAKRKTNVVTLGTVALLGPERLESVLVSLRELSEYGRKRGVYVSLQTVLSLSLFWGSPEKDLIPIRPECGVSKAGGCCYGDDMLKKQAEALTEFCQKYKPGMLRFHFIDSDPFFGCGGEAGWWTRRCDVCKAKYKDSERWKADRDMIKSMYEAIKKGSSDTKIELVLWPYHSGMIAGGWPLWFGSEKRYQRYLKKITADLPEDVLIALRETSRPLTEVWDKYTNQQGKMVWYFTYNGFGRWVSSWGKDAATWWTGKNDGFEISECSLWLCYQVSNLIGTQYAWNVKTPGYKIWDNIMEMQQHNNSMKPTYEPEFVFKVLVPLICRDVYGDKAGPYVEKALKTNIERGLPGALGGWRHSRWEVDIEGKERAETGQIVDPLKNYGEIREEANIMYANMSEAMKHLPEDNLRRWVIETLWFKARELRCRGEGFYHWVLAAQNIERGSRDEALKEVSIATAYLDREGELMKEAGEQGYPAGVAGMGYVPYYRRPFKDIRAWAQKNNLSIPSNSVLKELLERVDRKPEL